MSPSDQRHTISAARIAATVKADGAELCSLRDAAGCEFLWQAGSAWPRHAPVLFPIVGRLNGDHLRHDGAVYHLTQHGFARDRRFAWSTREAAICRLVLEDDAETRTLYPFAFRLELTYAVADDTLTVTYVITNPGQDVLPVSIGAHPAFRWPLAEGIARDQHRLEFAQPEPAPVRRLQAGLLRLDRFPTPVNGRVLDLRDALFAEDALILDRPVSRSVCYTAPGAPRIEIGWDGFDKLGIWSRAGGDFLCIEPWHGIADPVGFDGAFATKPGLMHIPPGEAATLSLSVRISPPDSARR
jgi:galactose mutarotase-like enzyme